MYNSQNTTKLTKAQLITALLKAQDAYLELKASYTDLPKVSKELRYLNEHYRLNAQMPKPQETKPACAGTTNDSGPLAYKQHELPYYITTKGTTFNPIVTLNIDYEDHTYTRKINSDKFLNYIKRNTKDNKLLVSFIPWEKNPKLYNIEVIKR